MDAINTIFRWVIYWPISRTLMFLAGLACAVLALAITILVAVIAAMCVIAVGLAIVAALVVGSVAPFALSPNVSIWSWINSTFSTSSVEKEDPSPKA